jgi:TonB family protein
MEMRTKRVVPSGWVRWGLAGCVTLLLTAVMATGTAFAKQVDASGQAQETKWGKVYRADKTIKPAVLVSSVEPQYPKSAVAAKGTSTTCVVGGILDKAGKLHDVHIVRSGGREFDRNAMQAVRQYKFTPALRFGKPVAVAINVEVKFRKQ